MVQSKKILKQKIYIRKDN